MSAQFSWRSQVNPSAAAAGIRLLPDDTRRIAPFAGLRGRAQAFPLRAVLLACIALAFAAGYWFSYPRDIGSEPVFNSPRESVGYHLTERFIAGHGYSMPLRHYDALPRDIAIALTPRDAANLDGEVVPKDFVGTMLLYTAVMRVHPSLALFVTPFFAVVGAWALMRVGEELFGRAAGILAFVSWLAFAPLWVNASFIFVSDLPALAFLLFALLMFVQHWRAPTALSAALLAASFCAAVMFRYPNILLAPPFVIAALLGGRIKLVHAAAAAVATLPFAGTVLLFNAIVYGDPLTTGFHLGADLMSETVNYSGESFFKQRPDVLVEYVLTYGRETSIALPVALSCAATICAVITQRSLVRVVAILTLATLAILIAYYGQQDAWGYKSPQASASVLRYLLPGFAMCTLFGAWGVVQVARRFGRLAYVLPIAPHPRGGCLRAERTRGRERSAWRRRPVGNPRARGRRRNGARCHHRRAHHGQGALP